MDRDAQPLGRGIKMIFLGVGVLTLVVGLVMFLLPIPAGVGDANGAQPVGNQWWPWPLRTPFVTRFLGALFTGIGVGAFWSSRQERWGQVRGLFPPGLTFTALATIASFMHYSSFNPQRIATWAFFALYLVVFALGLIAFVQYERGPTR